MFRSFRGRGVLEYEYTRVESEMKIRVGVKMVLTVPLRFLKEQRKTGIKTTTNQPCRLIYKTLKHLQYKNTIVI